MKVFGTSNTEGTQKQVDGKRVVKSDDNFKLFLKDELGQGEAVDKTQQNASEETSTSAVDSVSVLDLLSKVSNLTDGMGPEISGIADRLNTVEKKLLSGSIGSEDLGEAINTISSEAERLESSTQNLPTDHPLRQVAGQLSILAHVEQIKWQRGDYL